MEQLYDPVRALFLADRHVRGTCPRCGAAEQPGDNCDACGATYDATELGAPRSVLSDAAPQRKSSVHYFFDSLLTRIDKNDVDRVVEATKAEAHDR